MPADSGSFGPSKCLIVDRKSAHNSSMRRPLPGVSPALLELLERSGELDRILDGRGLLFDNPPAPPAPPPEPWIIPRPDWEQERAEREAREREQRVREAAQLLESAQ